MPSPLPSALLGAPFSELSPEERAAVVDAFNRGTGTDAVLTVSAPCDDLRGTIDTLYARGIWNALQVGPDGAIWAQAAAPEHSPRPVDALFKSLTFRFPDCCYVLECQ